MLVVGVGDLAEAGEGVAELRGGLLAQVRGLLGDQGTLGQVGEPGPFGINSGP